MKVEIGFYPQAALFFKSKVIGCPPTARGIFQGEIFQCKIFSLGGGISREVVFCRGIFQGGVTLQSLLTFKKLSVSNRKINLINKRD